MSGFGGLYLLVRIRYFPTGLTGLTGSDYRYAELKYIKGKIISIAPN
jgi:hypothetical protein